MNYRVEQEKFDKVKWYDSILVGYDRCGSYEFCVKCDKTQNNPCARAMQKANKKRVRIGIVRFRV
ncbi:MAG: hypothetical protein IJX09_03980 [Clostridia bacterium]|nr:hypothetical protein [Clostridia bacterium]